MNKPTVVPGALLPTGAGTVLAALVTVMIPPTDSDPLSAATSGIQAAAQAVGLVAMVAVAAVVLGVRGRRPAPSPPGAVWFVAAIELGMCLVFASPVLLGLPGAVPWAIAAAAAGLNAAGLILQMLRPPSPDGPSMPFVLAWSALILPGGAGLWMRSGESALTTAFFVTTTLAGLVGASIAFPSVRAALGARTTSQPAVAEARQGGSPD